MERARGGETAAFEQIFERYHQEIYRYCLATLRNPSDAEDAMQATMSAALRALPGESREIELRPWLYRVAYNESVSLLRDRARTVGPEALAEATAGSAQVEAEDRERLRELVVDLNGLPERQRGALVMRELSGLSYAEIGAALGSSERAARQIVYEAREALRMREEGRDMDCAQARRTISDGDRRRLRGRRLRAHLTACEDCAGFERAIARRRDDLQALCPPLPLVAAAAIGNGLGAGSGAAVGGSLATGGAGALGGGLVAGAGAGATVKGASVVAAAVLATAIAGTTNLIVSGDRPGAERPSGHAVEQAHPAAAPTGAPAAGSERGAVGRGRDGPGPGTNAKPGTRGAEPGTWGAGKARDGSKPNPGVRAHGDPVRPPHAGTPGRPAQPPAPAQPPQPPASNGSPGAGTHANPGAGASGAPGRNGTAPGASGQPPTKDQGKSSPAIPSIP